MLTIRAVSGAPTWKNASSLPVPSPSRVTPSPGRRFPVTVVVRRRSRSIAGPMRRILSGALASDAFASVESAAAGVAADFSSRDLEHPAASSTAAKTNGKAIFIATLLNRPAVRSRPGPHPAGDLSKLGEVQTPAAGSAAIPADSIRLLRSCAGAASLFPERWEWHSVPALPVALPYFPRRQDQQAFGMAPVARHQAVISAPYSY